MSDEPITPAEPNGAIPDLHFWRYDTPTGMCDHPITVTNRATLWVGSRQATTTEAITICLDCDQIFHQEDR